MYSMTLAFCTDCVCGVKEKEFNRHIVFWNNKISDSFLIEWFERIDKCILIPWTWISFRINNGSVLSNEYVSLCGCSSTHMYKGISSPIHMSISIFVVVKQYDWNRQWFLFFSNVFILSVFCCAIRYFWSS